jgi:outer membrane lipoprotein carrier protein
MGGFWRAGARPAACIAIVLCCVAELLSQPSETRPEAPAPSLHNMAQQVDRHYNQLHSLKAEFTEIYAGMGMQRNEGGTLLLEKPGRMRWDYSSPAGKVFLLDGKYAWFYKQGDAQVQRIEAKKLDDLRSPLRYLLGHAQLEKEMDHLAMAPAAGGEYTLTGQPKGQEDRIARVKLTVTRDGAIKGIDIEETDGAVTRFNFAGEQDNVPMAAGEFRFLPPAGVTVVDALPTM